MASSRIFPLSLASFGLDKPLSESEETDLYVAVGDVASDDLVKVFHGAKKAVEQVQERLSFTRQELLRRINIGTSKIGKYKGFTTADGTHQALNELRISKSVNQAAAASLLRAKGLHALIQFKEEIAPEKLQEAVEFLQEHGREDLLQKQEVVAMESIEAVHVSGALTESEVKSVVITNPCDVLKTKVLK